ncbi:MAG: tyrosine-type recombinase/integrase, partial [Candidatus Lokiarchaeota archaeon]|nr:tyrosine-type recombinase/integrase [Candidatus Lokiarchaeota archaeon]
MDSISLTTKQLKWSILKSFLDYCVDYYEDDFDFVIKFPNRLVKWKPMHKDPNSNADVFLTVEEIKKILDMVQGYNFKYYLIFRVFAETGVRKGELINIDYDKINLEKRYIDTKGKRGRKAYFFSEDLRNKLTMFIEERKLIKTETKALFLSSHSNRFTNRPFNKYLKKITPKLGIDKNVTCQVFRRSLNALRFKMGCTNDVILRILLNHSVKGVNFNNYVKKS